MKVKTGPWCVYLGLVAVILACCGPVWASAADKVELVEVQTQILGQVPQPLLVERVNRAVAEVAQNALIGRPIAEVAQFATFYRQSLTEVYNSTISGFALEQLEIVPGRISLVHVVLRPTGAKIDRVTVDFSLTEELPEWVTADLYSQLELVVPSLTQVYDQVVLHSLSWGGQALFSQAKALLPQVPGFDFTLTVVPAEHTELVVKIVPQNPRIYEVKLEADSRTLPPVLLRKFNTQIRTPLTQLVGLPVAYARAKLSDLEQRLQRDLANTQHARQARLNYQVSLSAAPLTVANVHVESAIYKLRWEGAVNFGNEARPELGLEAGRYLSAETRLLADVKIPVTTLDFQLGLGLGLHVLNGDLVFVYSLSTEKPELRFEYELDSKQRVRLKRDWHNEDWELAYGLKQTNYLTTEIVGNTSGVWLRLVGSL